MSKLIFPRFHIKVPYETVLFVERTVRSLAIFNEQFSQEGPVSDNLKKGINRVSKELDFDFISSALVARYESLGKPIKVENLRRFG